MIPIPLRKRHKIQCLWKFKNHVLPCYLNSCRLNRHVLLSRAHCREPQNKADHVNTFPPQDSPEGESSLGLEPELSIFADVRSPPSIPKANSESATWSPYSLAQIQKIILITAQMPKFLEKVNRMKVFASVFHEVTALA